MVGGKRTTEYVCIVSDEYVTAITFKLFKTMNNSESKHCVLKNCTLLILSVLSIYSSY
jgi:hypothetical protein